MNVSYVQHRINGIVITEIEAATDRYELILTTPQKEIN